MNRVRGELRDIADRLDVPQPMRARVVEELNADFHDMAEEMLALRTELYAVSGRMAELSGSTAVPGDVRAIALPWLRRNAAMASIGLLVGGTRCRRMTAA